MAENPVSYYIIGMMSGTSADGIDTVIVQFSPSTHYAKYDDTFQVIAKSFTPFSTDLRQQINYLAHSRNVNTKDTRQLDNQLAQIYAKASLEIVQKANIPITQISAIANHGQTIKHNPNATPPYSIQLGSGQMIANITQIATICEFRQADLDVGGQGAPLMPAFHQALLHQEQASLVLNLGGIANLTYLGERIIGFDTGPANTLLDQWSQLHTQQPYDKHSEWALSGTAHQEVISALLDDPYFKQDAPKSTGPDYFNLTWLENKLKAAPQTKELNQYATQDIQASLLYLTIESIALAIKKLNSQARNCYLCGGGANNSAIRKLLKAQLPSVDFIHFSHSKYAQLGVDADYLEAIGFAWLGYCHLHKIRSNLCSVTGANETVVLGKMYRPN